MIENEEQYDQALKKIEELWDHEPDSPEEKEFIDLTEEVIAYEKIHYPIDPPTPEALMEFLTDNGCPNIEQRMKEILGDDYNKT